MASTNPWRRELGSLVRLALPVVLAELGWMLQGVVDVIMVGHLGPVAIGAVALGNAVYYAPSLFGVGLLLGMDTVVSHAFGRKDYDACHRWMAQGAYIAIVISIPIMLLLAGVSLLLPHLHVADVMVAPATSYLRVLLWGTLPLLLYVAARRYLQSIGQVRIITLTFVGANLMNWGGNWVLINGKLGFPMMGVAGSALSTVLSRIMMAVTLFWFAWSYERRRGHPLFAHWARPVGREIRELVRLGLPTAFQLLMELGAFGLATVIAGTISPVALAAHQIALNSAALAYMVPLGISAAAAVSVGHAVGAGDPARARRAGWMSLGLGIAFMMMIAVLFLTTPRPLIALYTKDPAVMAVGVPLFALASAFAVFDGVQIVATGALRGLGLTRVPMLANFVGYWIVGIPMGVALCFWAHWGVFGVWTGLTTALILISLVLFFYWRRRSAAIVAV